MRLGPREINLRISNGEDSQELTLVVPEDEGDLADIVVGDEPRIRADRRRTFLLRLPRDLMEVMIASAAGAPGDLRMALTVEVLI